MSEASTVFKPKSVNDYYFLYQFFISFCINDYLRKESYQVHF